MFCPHGASRSTADVDSEQSRADNHSWDSATEEVVKRVALPERSSCLEEEIPPCPCFRSSPFSLSVWENHKETPRFAPGILASVIQAERSTWHRIPTQTKTLPLSARWLPSFCRPGPPILPGQEGQSACGPVLTYKAPHVTVSPPLPDSIWCVLQGPAQVSPPPGSPPARALEVGAPVAWHPLDAGSHPLHSYNGFNLQSTFFLPGMCKAVRAPSAVGLVFSPPRGWGDGS
ncbi:uncharacterized protein LOC131518912 [Neofelis nebulosa]|uniref:uncharacterized protein LOC131518912 n=1 Tax=Neofelis nebulosa TaxID=61452 RepID=UPI00272C8788|nr:uncharacterized protein LOC131518912 [Neofelis nebulosa]